MMTDSTLKLLICIVLIMRSQGRTSDCQECDDYLISGPRGIPDSHLSASSIFPNIDALHDPKNGRLYFFQYNATTGFSAAAWTALYNDDQQYIQAMFSSVKKVKAISTQGRSNKDQWVASFHVSYSLDGITWSMVLNPDKTTMIFQANRDRLTVIKNVLPECIKAKYVRIHPKTWHNYVSLRFDVIGCTEMATETLRNQMLWTRHPVDLSPTVYHNVRKSIQSFSWNKKSCAVQCLSNEQCLMFSFNKEAGTCTGFPSQIYQRQMPGSNLEKDLYFISLFCARPFFIISIAHLHGYEYEIVESKMFGYKIFTRRTNAESALARCHKEGTGLLTLYDLDHMEYVQNKIKDNLILSQESKYYVDGSKKDGKWKYSTGIDIPHSVWEQAHPMESNGNCVTLTMTGLQTHDCHDSLYFVCGV